MDRVHYYESPLGRIVMTGNGGQLTGLWFEQSDQDDPAAVTGAAGCPDSVFDETDRWLDIFFSGRDPGYTPPVSLDSTPFRMGVWKILMTIPYGETMSYGEIAAIMAKNRGIGRMSAQAVGGAVGHNPVSLIIPCHRVIGSDGSLTGYAWGIERKMKLLELERHGRIRR